MRCIVSVSLEKTLMLGGIGGRRRRGQQRMRWLDASPTRWTWVCVNSRSWWWTGRPGVLRFMGSQGVRNDWVTELTDWLTDCKLSYCFRACCLYSAWKLAIIVAFPYRCFATSQAVNKLFNYSNGFNSSIHYCKGLF